MRGCFLLEIARMELPEAFPAYAGMFLYLTPLHKPNLSFPRVCGDVSNSPQEFLNALKLSPRMRGCFRRHKRPNYLEEAFPAYAGMFPRPGTE